MISENGQIGEMFRKKREELNLSLKEVENSTSIRMGYLQAIEEGNIDQCISGVYALGFTKQYGTFLGFDIQKLQKDSPQAFIQKNEKYEFSFGIGTMEPRRIQASNSNWLANILWSSAAVIFFILVYFFSKSVGLL